MGARTRPALTPGRPITCIADRIESTLLNAKLTPAVKPTSPLADLLRVAGPCRPPKGDSGGLAGFDPERHSAPAQMRAGSLYNQYDRGGSGYPPSQSRSPPSLSKSLQGRARARHGELRRRRPTLGAPAPGRPSDSVRSCRLPALTARAGALGEMRTLLRDGRRGASFIATARPAKALYRYRRMFS